jgi:hypothetical protein
MDATVLGGVRDRLRGARQRGPLTAVAAVVLMLVAVGFAPHPVGRAAVGTVPDSIPVFVGVLTTDETLCTVTLVRPWMAITPKHCGTSNPLLKVGVASRNEDSLDNRYEVRKIVQHPTLDVQMLYLYRTTPWNTLVSWGKGSEYDPASGEPLRVWGFGLDRHNTLTDGLRMAAFPGNAPCPSDLASDGGDFCFNTTSLDSVCSGDSGAPVTQGDKIVAMATAVKRSDPSRPFDCADVVAGQAISLQKIEGWLLDHVCEAAPPEVWPCG